MPGPAALVYSPDSQLRGLAGPDPPCGPTPAPPHHFVMRPDRIDDNRSAWLAELPPDERSPPLRGTATADIAVIGGGITGVSTAWHLAGRYPDRRVVLLEA